MHGPFVSYWSNSQMQMSVVWDEALRYKKMRSWDHGIMGSWDHGIMGSWDHGIVTARGLPAQAKCRWRKLANKILLLSFRHFHLIKNQMTSKSGKIKASLSKLASLSLKVRSFFSLLWKSDSPRRQGRSILILKSREITHHHFSNLHL